MPEAPEVELVRRELEALAGARITDLELQDSKLSPELREVAGARVAGVRRHGKLLGFTLDNGVVLACHLRLTGALTFAPAAHIRAVLRFSNGRSLYFSDPRRFGTLELTDTERFGAGQGPDLLSSPSLLPGTWPRTRRPVKAVLLDQKVIAGVGNYLADEACFATFTHPFTPTCLLDESAWAALCAAAHDVAVNALAHGGVSFSDYKHVDGSAGRMQERLLCYGRAGKPCGRCRTMLARTTVAGRGTTFCPHCQAAVILYTNWRGETAPRVIVPGKAFRGATNWHPRPQWLLEAFDVAKSAERTFALDDIHTWAPAART